MRRPCKSHVAVFRELSNVGRPGSIFAPLKHRLDLSSFHDSSFSFKALFLSFLLNRLLRGFSRAQLRVSCSICIDAALSFVGKAKFIQDAFPLLSYLLNPFSASESFCKGVPCGAPSKDKSVVNSTLSLFLSLYCGSWLSYLMKDALTSIFGCLLMLLNRKQKNCVQNTKQG